MAERQYQEPDAETTEQVAPMYSRGHHQPDHADRDDHDRVEHQSRLDE
jgi:hypothetical protein